MLRAFITAVCMLAAVACAPKEARNPSEILAEDPAFLPAESMGAAPDGSVPPAAEPLASRRECEDAARHLEELALDIAMRNAETPEAEADLRRRRGQLMSSTAVRDRIEHATEECLARRTSAREARCVARVRSDSELDACTR